MHVFGVGCAPLDSAIDTSPLLAAKARAVGSLADFGGMAVGVLLFGSESGNILIEH